MNQRPTEEKQGPEERDLRLGPDQSRRRMLRRSLTVAAPVVATLASRPVSAGACLSASAFLSGNASRTPLQNACTGHSPAQWIALLATSWPAGVVKAKDGNVQATTFLDIFGNELAKVDGVWPKNPTLLEVLGGYDSTPATAVQQAGAVTAVWLNAKTGRTGVVFTPASVLEIWASIVANSGGYPISATKSISPQDTHNWLALVWTSF